MYSGNIPHLYVFDSNLYTHNWKLWDNSWLCCYLRTLKLHKFLLRKRCSCCSKQPARERLEHYRGKGCNPEDLPARSDCLILVRSYAPSCSDFISFATLGLWWPRLTWKLSGCSPGKREMGVWTFSGLGRVAIQLCPSARALTTQLKLSKAFEYLLWPLLRVAQFSNLKWLASKDMK